jgi:hypothetical protein
MGMIGAQPLPVRSWRSHPDKHVGSASFLLRYQAALREVLEETGAADPDADYRRLADMEYRDDEILMAASAVTLRPPTSERPEGCCWPGIALNLAAPNNKKAARARLRAALIRDRQFPSSAAAISTGPPPRWFLPNVKTRRRDRRAPLPRALRRWSDCQVSRTAFGAGRRRRANFDITVFAARFASTARPTNIVV